MLGKQKPVRLPRSAPIRGRYSTVARTLGPRSTEMTPNVQRVQGGAINGSPDRSDWVARRAGIEMFPNALKTD